MRNNLRRLLVPLPRRKEKARASAKAREKEEEKEEARVVGSPSQALLLASLNLAKRDIRNVTMVTMKQTMNTTLPETAKEDNLVLTIRGSKALLIRRRPESLGMLAVEPRLPMDSPPPFVLIFLMLERESVTVASLGRLPNRNGLDSEVSYNPHVDWGLCGDDFWYGACFARKVANAIENGTFESTCG